MKAISINGVSDIAPFSPRFWGCDGCYVTYPSAGSLPTWCEGPTLGAGSADAVAVAVAAGLAVNAEGEELPSRERHCEYSALTLVQVNLSRKKNEEGQHRCHGTGAIKLLMLTRKDK